MSMISGIQGQLLEVTVVSCNKLKDTEWISRQDPYVCLEYGSTKFRTRTCTDGGKNPTFQEKFVFTLIEGLQEINVVVWNSNTLTYDDLIGSGKIQLQKVLSMGYDDTAWPIQTKTGSFEVDFIRIKKDVIKPPLKDMRSRLFYLHYRHAGEVRLIMFYANANKVATSYAPSYTAPQTHSTQKVETRYALSYTAPQMQTPMYSVPPPATAYQTSSPYPAYPPHSAAYPPTPYPPPQPTTYPPVYPPPSTYPPMSYPPLSSYPPVSYPPPTQDYTYPPGPYPPRPY